MSGMEITRRIVDVVRVHRITANPVQVTVEDIRGSQIGVTPMLSLQKHALGLHFAVHGILEARVGHQVLRRRHRGEGETHQEEVECFEHVASLLPHHSKAPEERVPESTLPHASGPFSVPGAHRPARRAAGSGRGRFLGRARVHVPRDFIGVRDQSEALDLTSTGDFHSFDFVVRVRWVLECLQLCLPGSFGCFHALKNQHSLVHDGIAIIGLPVAIAAAKAS